MIRTLVCNRLVFALALFSASASAFAGEGNKEVKASFIMNESEVAAAVSALNQGEIQLAQFAQDRAATPVVLHFIQTLVADHTMLENNLNTTLSYLGLIKLENKISSALKLQTQATMDTLTKFAAFDFDKAYIQEIIKSEARALKLIDGTFLPYTRTLQLQQVIGQTRNIIASHYNEAVRLGQILPLSGQE